MAQEDNKFLVIPYNDFYQCYFTYHYKAVDALDNIQTISIPGLVFSINTLFAKPAPLENPKILILFGLIFR